ncbi:MAG: hypothetical protein L0Y56_16560, partial [Nitrospira sp.]|nr:hypothetical protein [Nitrospira sp.]
MSIKKIVRDILVDFSLEEIVKEFSLRDLVLAKLKSRGVSVTGGVEVHINGETLVVMSDNDPRLSRSVTQEEIDGGFEVKPIATVIGG